MKEGKIEYKKGNGTKWHDGSLMPTTIAILPNGEEYEYLTNSIDRLLMDDLNRSLNHSLDHLKNIRFTIAFSDRLKQSRYADNVCKETVNEKGFVKKQLDGIINLNDVKLFEQFNATTVGNLAYLTIHAPKKYRGKAEKLLVNYKKYVQSLQN